MGRLAGAGLACPPKPVSISQPGAGKLQKAWSLLTKGLEAGAKPQRSAPRPLQLFHKRLSQLLLLCGSGCSCSVQHSAATGA